MDREIKRHDQTKMQLKRLETQFSNLTFILRRLYRDTFSIVQKLRSKFQKQAGNMTNSKSKINANLSKFSDSLGILNLSPEEIQMFVEAPSSKKYLSSL